MTDDLKPIARASAQQAEARYAKDALLGDMVDIIDNTMGEYAGRTLVSAPEVIDVLLDLRSLWVQIVLADAPVLSSSLQASID